MFNRGFRTKTSAKIAETYTKTLIDNITPSEQSIESLLKESNIEYIFQYSVSNADHSKFYILDFYLPKYKTCLEIDGLYHSTTEQIRLDKDRDYNLLLKGIKTIRIANSTSKIINYNDLIILLEAVEEIKKYNTTYYINNLKVFTPIKMKFVK